MKQAAGSLGACSLARILHGVSSPGFSSQLWSRQPFWGRYWAVDFGALLRRVREALEAPAAADAGS